MRWKCRKDDGNCDCERTADPETRVFPHCPAVRPSLGFGFIELRVLARSCSAEPTQLSVLSIRTHPLSLPHARKCPDSDASALKKPQTMRADFFGAWHADGGAQRPVVLDVQNSED